jgi:hypothetical protein
MQKVSQFRLFHYKAKQAKLAHFLHVSFWFIVFLGVHVSKIKAISLYFA